MKFFLRQSFKRQWWRVLLFFTIGLFLSVLLLFIPWNTSSLHSRPQPVKTYTEALQRIDDLKSSESRAMNPVCNAQLLTQGKSVKRAIILVHGYTSCPQQFMELGTRFYRQGYNVLLAPMPHHGLSDRMTEAHSKLTAEELARYADQMVDIAQGLGDTVIMMGLSAGAVVTAFAAKNRRDLDIAVLISPAFGYKKVPTIATSAAMNAFSVLPNGYGWWDVEKQEQGGVPHGYPRYSQRALAQALRLSYAARSGKPKAGKILVVTNPNDEAINNEITYEEIKDWRKQKIKFETYEFPAALKLPHDLIEPLAPEGNIEVVYGKLVELVEGNARK